MPRRRPGVLLPLEEAILELGCAKAAGGGRRGWFHGFALAAELAEGDDRRRLLGHGTLYKALDRLETEGLLESRWEDVDASASGRPRRREYHVTGDASAALSRSRQLQAPAVAPRWAAT